MAEKAKGERRKAKEEKFEFRISNLSSLALWHCVGAHGGWSRADVATDSAPAVETKCAHDDETCDQRRDEDENDEGQPRYVDGDFRCDERVDISSGVIVDEGRNERLNGHRIGAVIETVGSEPRPQYRKEQARGDEET